MATDNKRGHIQTAQGEFMKWHYVYDITLRPEYIYEVHTDASNGDPCMVTQYSYVGSTTRIENAKESSSTWDSTWDIT